MGIGLFLLATVPACGDSDESTATEPSGVLEVFSWWTSGGEKAAFDALVAEFNGRYPKVEVINAAQVGTEDARALFKQRMVDGDPPDTFQETAAGGIFQWVGDENDQSGSKLVNLEQLAAKEGWKSAFSEEVRSLVTLGGTMWAVPINVHRLNTVMYNVQMLADVDMEPPETYDELMAVCEALDAADMVCWGLGVKSGWTATLWLMDGLFPATASPEHRTQFLRGELSGDDDGFRDMLEKAAALLAYSNPNRGELEWDGGAKLVTAGDAAFNPMGDWAYAELKNAGGEAGTDFDVITHPGANGVFVMNFDNFPMPAGAKNPTAGEAWLKVVGSEAGQNAFNLLKGSIPARAVDDSSEFDAYGQRTIAEFGTDDTNRVTAAGAILNPGLEPEMNEVFAEFMIDRDVDAVITWFNNNYSRFEK
jgi:glucose/mannose transport system substrate-binding protein